jgi:hypothetical protein
VPARNGKIRFDELIAVCISLHCLTIVEAVSFGGGFMGVVDFLVAAFAVTLVAVTVFHKARGVKKGGCACDGCGSCRSETEKNR